MAVKLGSAYGEVKIGYDGGGIGQALTALGGLTSTLSFVGDAVKALVGPLIDLGKETISMAGEFQSSMAVLGIAARSAGLSVGELHDAALAVGSDTALVGVSASGAAEAMTGLYKAGLSNTEIFGDLNGYMAGTAELGGALRASIDLAAATELSMVEASELATVALSSFGAELESEEARAQFINAAMNNFVQTADASVAGVSGLRDAMVTVGPSAAAFGFSLQDTNNALAILSTRGIQGAEAGTALKSMLTNMMRQTPEVTAALADLNVTLYDQQGNMRPLPVIIGQFEQALQGMTEAQRNQYVQTVAGTYGMNALNTLLTDGVSGWNAMAEATANAATIQDQAAAKAMTFEGSLEALSGVGEALGISLGEGLLPVLTDVIRTVAGIGEQILPAVQSIAAGIGAILSGAWQTLKTFVSSLAEALGINFGAIQGNAGNWGANIVVSLARGMASAIQAVVQVLMAIGRTIANFLRPGSPPKLLPDLDNWAAETATIYMDGWGEADYSVFNTLGSTIRDYLTSLGEEVVPKDMLRPWMASFQEAIAGAINASGDLTQARAAFEDLFAAQELLPASMRDYALAMMEAQFAQQTLDEAMEMLESIADATGEELQALVETAGEMEPAFGAYAQALVDVETAQQAVDDSMDALEAASEAVAAAQEELNAVTERYRGILAPLNAEMSALDARERAIRDQMRLAEIEEELQDASLSDAERELLLIEQQQIQLRQQIQTVEDQQAAEEEAAQANVDAAEAAEAAAQAEVDARQEALAAAEEAADAALEAARAEVEARQEAVEVTREAVETTQALIRAQTDANNALREQGDILKGLEDSAASLGDKLKEGLATAGFGLGDSIQSAFDALPAGGLDLGLDLGMLAEDATTVTSSIEEMVAQITAQFVPLEGQVQELGSVWGEVFGGAGGIIERVKLAFEGVSAWWTENGPGIKEAADGMFAKFQEVAGDLAERIMPWLSEKLAQFGAWFTENGPLIREYVTMMSERWKAFADLLLGAWEVIRPILDGLIKIVLDIAKLFMQVATGDWTGAWETIKSIVSTAWTSIKEAVINFFDWVASWFGGSLEQIKEIWSSNWEMVRLIVSTVWENIKTIVSDAFEAVKTWINVRLQAIKAIWSQIWDLIKTKVSEIWDSIKEKIDLVLGLIDTAIGDDLRAIQTAWGEIWTAIFDFVSDVWTQKIQPVIDDTIQAIKTWIGDRLTEIQGTWSEIWDSIKSKAEEVWTNIQTFITDTIEAIKTWITVRIQAIKAIWSQVWDLILEKVAGIWTSIKEKISTAIENIKTAFSTVDWGGIGAAIVNGIAGGIMNVAGNIASAAAEAVRNALQAARDALGIESPSKVAAKQLGEPMAEGIGIGWIDALQSLQRVMSSSLVDMVSLSALAPTAAVPAVNNTAAWRPQGPAANRLTVYGGLALYGVQDAEGLLAELGKLL